MKHLFVLAFILFVAAAACKKETIVKQQDNYYQTTIWRISGTAKLIDSLPVRTLPDSMYIKNKK